MICYVDMEHDEALRIAEQLVVHQVHCTDVKLRLERATGHVCVVRRYTRVTQPWLRESEIRALVIGGNVMALSLTSVLGCRPLPSAAR